MMRRFVFLLLILATPGYAIDFLKTDIFGSVGSDFTLMPRANYTVGIGRKFQLKPNPKKKVRWELVGTYSYENNGNHGFLHTAFAAHTEALGVVRSIHLPGRFTSFIMTRGGATTYTGQDKDPKSFFSTTGGVGMHIHYRYTLTATETISKVDTVPVYYTTGLALTHGWWGVNSSFNRTSGKYGCHLNFVVSLSALMSGEHKEHPHIIPAAK